MRSALTAAEAASLTVEMEGGMTRDEIPGGEAEVGFIKPFKGQEMERTKFSTYSRPRPTANNAYLGTRCRSEIERTHIERRA